ncbi:MAG: hypothetical protein FJW96_13340, partial [Actinobacteria bacterium]|nr:hypothetical protein [Actinomycetota bacterium]
MSGEILLQGGSVLDVGTGETERRDLGVRDGVVVPPADLSAPQVVEADGLTVCFGLWDCHAHPGSLMYDPSAKGYFDGSAEWSVRAYANLVEAARMGITGVRTMSEADGVDIAWSRAFREGVVPGPRVSASGIAIRTTGGHGTAFPRRHLRVEAELVCDGEVEVTRAVRRLVEQGSDWVKVMLTGGLYSPNETVDGGQLTDEELVALV